MFDDPQLQTLVMLAVLLLLVLVMVLLQVLLRPRRKKDEERQRELHARLDALERQQTEAGERLRAGFETGLRETALALTSKSEEGARETQRALYDRFEQMQKGLAESLAQSRRSQDERLDKVEAALSAFRERLDRELANQRTSLLETTGQAAEKQSKAASELQQLLTDRLETLRGSTEKTLREVQDAVRAQLEALRKENEARLEKMRETVDEKLQGTLEKRLGQSFDQVSKQLERVSRGLGEMQTLATGVGDLKRVLANVSSRGALGEVQLETLLEQILAPAQYRRNATTHPTGTARVEFAIVLPGEEDGHEVLLPIDCKFPTEDYARLQDAYQNADKEASEAARRALARRLRDEAKTIESKYINPPHTTNFALLFLPTEGLFAEALRIPGLVEELQRTSRVVLVGPTTLYAYLNALQMGFRTLAIQKRSSEVWRLLSAVKTEFHKFGESLGAVSKSLETASKRIDKSARRSRAIERQLRGVEMLDHTEARRLLPGEEPATDNGDPEENEAEEE